MNSRDIIKNLQPSPPPDININALDSNTVRALSALVEISDGIQRRSDTSQWILGRSWNKAWPWILSLSRAVMDDEPSTIAGYKTTDKILRMSPYLLMSYIRDGPTPVPDNDPTMEAGGKRIRAYPKIPALALELWLLAAALEHPIASLLCDTAGMYIAFLLLDADKSPPKTLFDELLKTSRWDIPGALVRGIVREASRSLIDCCALRNHLGMLASITGIHPSRSIFLATCSRKQVPKWAVYAINRLAEHKRWGYDATSGRPIDVAAALSRALAFISFYFTCDPFLMVQALDAGIVFSMFRHRDTILESLAADKGLLNSADVAADYSKLLDALAPRLYHRPLLVRVVRSIKKVAKAEIDPKAYLKDCGPLLESWTKLCAEATTRQAPSRNGEGWYDDAICGSTKCPLRRTLKMDHKFKRCNACHFEIYCSVECQKSAWKQHRLQCSAKRKLAQETREPSSLDLAFLRKCVYQDFYASPPLFQHAVHRIIKNEHTIIWLDYTKKPKQVKGIPLSWINNLTGNPMNTSYSSTDLDESFSGQGLVPWRERMPITVFIRTESDRMITAHAKMFKLDWRQVATGMHEMIAKENRSGK
ncbi:hypothetical protein PM082_021211 [Marasmius tenuissimus]|nr:hypothetical protein PM082_021211 [Marasmius tenuissimus]